MSARPNALGLALAVLAASGALAGCAGSKPTPAKKVAGASSKAQAAEENGEGPDAVPPRARRLFDEAVRAEEDQRKLKVPTDWPYLERKWREVLTAADFAEARYNLGVVLEGQGRVGEARAEYERARALKPGLRQAVVNLGVLLEKQGDLRGAAEAYQSAATDFPEDAVSRERLAELYRASGQTDEAWRLAREALMRDPRSVGAQKVLVQVAYGRGDLDLAKLMAMRAQKVDASDPELPFVVGQVFAKQGDDDAAGAQFRKVLALRPDYLPARYALLEAALRKKTWGAVGEHAGAILKAEPGNAPVQLIHGLALRHLGKPDDALAAFKRAEEASGGKLPEVRLARGVLLARVKNQCEPALDDLKAYQRAVPVVQDAAEVTKIVRDCEQMLEENKKAAEAVKQMQAEAQKQKDKEKAKAAGTPAVPGTPAAPGAAAPGPAAPAQTGVPQKPAVSH